MLFPPRLVLCNISVREVNIAHSGPVFISGHLVHVFRSEGETNGNL